MPGSLVWFAAHAAGADSFHRSPAIPGQVFLTRLTLMFSTRGLLSTTISPTLSGSIDETADGHAAADQLLDSSTDQLNGRNALNIDTPGGGYALLPITLNIWNTDANQRILIAANDNGGGRTMQILATLEWLDEQDFRLAAAPGSLLSAPGPGGVPSAPTSPLGGGAAGGAFG